MNSVSDPASAAEFVLIVDDDESLRQSLVDVLAIEGVPSMVAGRADEALEMVEAHDPSIVVVDYHLPDGTGIDLAQTIKGIRPDTPVLLLTGHVTVDIALAAVGQLDAYLIKPVAPVVFVQSVVSALARRRLVGENKALVDRLKRINAYQALYDHLTGLPNRALLDDRLSQALSSCQRSGRAMAILFADLDGFKDINDLFGHQVGDQLLREVGRRMAERCRKSDTVARFGGDEFVLVCPDVSVTDDTCLIAAHLLKTLAEPILVDGVEHILTASIGIAVSSPGAPEQTAETLLRNADTAMYRAKQAGRSCFEIYNNEMRVQVMERFEIERGLRSSLQDTGFVVAYQPLIEFGSGRLVGAEALLRWNRAGHGTLLPAAFLPTAEESGLIVPIGLWVLDQTLSDLAAWNETISLPDQFKLWINVSPQQLVNPHFAEIVGNRLEAFGVRPEALGLEILEEALLDVGATEKVLSELREMGISLNLDDFGAGHSNLWWLQELPITGLKIDGRFVATMDAHDDERGTAIVSGLIGLAHALGLTVVAEGVEREAQADALNAMGCDLAQGFFYGHPGPADRLWRHGTMGDTLSRTYVHH
jgi:diguanylate cyclase (GGDEF)-like protein